jgi:hypothetical protein
LVRTNVEACEAVWGIGCDADEGLQEVEHSETRAWLLGEESCREAGAEAACVTANQVFVSHRDKESS